jgi:hypothetical protein
MLIVDGGYLSWTYGTKVSMHRSWNEGVRLDYGKKAKAIIALEGGNLWRNKIYPPYKHKRKEKAKEDPAREAKRKRVKYFVDNFIAADPSLNTIRVDGLEADDLVALFIMTTPGVEVIGVDKDLLQLPFDFTLMRKSGELVTRQSYIEKGPKSLRGCFTIPEDILLDLCLRGDRSDSIPRTLPRRAMKQARKIFNHPRPFVAGYKEFGDDFIRNLMLAALPGPNVFEPTTSPDDIVWLLQSRKYWKQTIRSDILEKMNKAKAAIRS